MNVPKQNFNNDNKKSSYKIGNEKSGGYEMNDAISLIDIFVPLIGMVATILVMAIIMNLIHASCVSYMSYTLDTVWYNTTQQVCLY